MLVAGQQEAQEADDRGHNGASSSQEHVRTIAALQRMQASQANFSNDPALDISRPKLRDNRQVSIPACAFSQSQMLPRPSLLHHEAVPSSFVTQCCSGMTVFVISLMCLSQSSLVMFPGGLGSCICNV